MKDKLSVVLLFVVAVCAFADWSASVTESYFTYADSTGIVDTVGGIGDTTATIYAAFRIAPEVSFRVTGPDVWAIYDMALGEDVCQEDPLVIINDGAAIIDLAFHLGAEDIVTAPDAVPWVSRDTWTATVIPSQYTLGIIVTDPRVTTGPGITEFEADDILRPGSPQWYLTAGQFRPFTSGLTYEHEGSVSLALRGTEGMNTVHTFFRLQVSRSGSLDDYPHAARVVITCRLSTG